jgi:hypothetical protein
LDRPAVDSQRDYSVNCIDTLCDRGLRDRKTWSQRGVEYIPGPHRQNALMTGVLEHFITLRFRSTDLPYLVQKGHAGRRVQHLGRLHHRPRIRKTPVGGPDSRRRNPGRGVH